MVASYQQVMTWAWGQSYKLNAINEFQSVADSWIVAHALAYGRVVVTREKPAPGSKKRIKIPDACDALKVKYLDPFTMLRDEDMSLVL